MPVPPTAGEPDEAAFSLTMLDVGQGLSVLVQADGKYLLYDGGGRGTSSYEGAIRDYIRNQLQDDIANDQLSLKEFVDPFTGEKAKKA